jgi:hypothetical protein
VDKIIPIGKVYQEFLSGRFPNNQVNKTAKNARQPATFKHAPPIKTQTKTTKLGNVRRLLGDISSSVFRGLVGE